MQAQLDFGDDAERALGADEEAGKVVAGGGFADATAGADDASVRHGDGQAHHVFAHGAVAHRVGAGGAGGRHAADGAGRGAGIDREEQPQVTEMGVQLLPRYAGFDAAIHIRLADIDDPRHARQVERDAAADGGHVAFQGGAGAPGHHRDMVGVAQGQHAGGLFRGFDKRDSVRQHRGLGVLAVAVVFAQGRVGGQALSQEGAGGFDDGFDGHACSPGLLGEGLAWWWGAGKGVGCVRVLKRWGSGLSV